MVGTALRRFWTDRCDVFVRESSVDPGTGRSVFEERQVYADLPCRLSYRLSFETLSGVRDVGDAAVSTRQAVKLFLAPEIMLPVGSKIVVRRGGREMMFARSGVPAVFGAHQEVRVERFERWV